METFSSRRAEENVQNWARGTCENGRGRLGGRLYRCEVDNGRHEAGGGKTWIWD